MQKTGLNLIRKNVQAIEIYMQDAVFTMQYNITLTLCVNFIESAGKRQGAVQT